MDEKILQSYIGLNPECNQPYIYIYMNEQHAIVDEAAALCDYRGVTSR